MLQVSTTRALRAVGRRAPRLSDARAQAKLRTTSGVPRIERVAQPVAEQVERQHEDENRKPRPDRHPWRLLDVVLRGVEHAAPARRRRLLAEAEEREAGFGDH